MRFLLALSTGGRIDYRIVWLVDWKIFELNIYYLIESLPSEAWRSNTKEKSRFRCVRIGTLVATVEQRRKKKSVGSSQLSQAGYRG